MKPLNVVVVGAAHYCNWTKNFGETFLRMGYPAEIVYNNSLPAPLGGSRESVTDIFEKAKRIFIKISPGIFRFLKQWRRRLSEREILLRLRGIEKDKDILIVFVWTPGSEWVLRKIKNERPNAQIVLWLGEPPIRDASWPGTFKYFDQLYIVDDGLWLEGVEEKFKEKFELIPLSTDEAVFHKVDKVPKRYQCEVSFVGRYISARADALQALKHRYLKVFGYGWEEGFVDHPWLQEKYKGPLSGEDVNLVYNGSKVVVGTLEPKDSYTTATQRTFDIALAGTLQVAEDVYLVNKLFGDSVVKFKSDKELGPLVEKYLLDDKEREDRAGRAYQIGLQYTYTKAAQKMIEAFKGLDVDTKHK